MTITRKAVVGTQGILPTPALPGLALQQGQGMEHMPSRGTALARCGVPSSWLLVAFSCHWAQEGTPLFCFHWCVSSNYYLFGQLGPLIASQKSHALPQMEPPQY